MKFHSDIKLFTPLDSSGVCFFDAAFFNLVSLNGISASAAKSLIAEPFIDEEVIMRHLRVDRDNAESLKEVFVANHLLLTSPNE